jgi:hypothetical protein
MPTPPLRHNPRKLALHLSQVALQLPAPFWILRFRNSVFKIDRLDLQNVAFKILA